MLLIAEVLMFIGGLYVAISGKMPSWIAGRGYKAEGTNARLVGGMMALPLPLAFCAGVVIGLTAPDSVGYASVFEIVVVVLVLILSGIFIRNIRVPQVPPQPPQPPLPPQQ